MTIDMLQVFSLPILIRLLQLNLVDLLKFNVTDFSIKHSIYKFESME